MVLIAQITEEGKGKMQNIFRDSNNLLYLITELSFSIKCIFLAAKLCVMSYNYLGFYLFENLLTKILTFH